jgi:RAB protein geranylgeranyltransferase component A
MERLGGAKDRDFNIDLIPKFIMAHGNLVKILLHTKVTKKKMPNELKPLSRFI